MSVLVVGEIIVAMGLIGGLLLLVSLKMVQQGYDMFGLKTFKFVWGSFLVNFVLHLILLTIVK